MKRQKENKNGKGSRNKNLQVGASIIYSLYVDKLFLQSKYWKIGTQLFASVVLLQNSKNSAYSSCHDEVRSGSNYIFRTSRGKRVDYDSCDTRIPRPTSGLHPIMQRVRGVSACAVRRGGNSETQTTKHLNVCVLCVCISLSVPAENEKRSQL